MRLPQGETRNCNLQKVLYIPGLAYNLFSVCKAAEAGKLTVFSKTGCEITDERRLVATGHRAGGHYFLDQVREDTALISSNTWHRRFAHLGEQNLNLLKTQHMVSGMCMTKGSLAANCKPCLDGRQQKTPFPRGEGKARSLLELVHSDVCGKMGTRSIGGAEYFVSFVDSCSHYTWIYPLKKKSQVFTTFVKWQAMVENETGRTLKVLRTDGGGEFTSAEFSSHLEDKGVKHEVTIPRTPEQNGVAERMNRTLVESVRSMLADAGLPKQFWAEALDTATYLRNRSPTKCLDQVTPEEVWSGVKPDVRHLRVFGCKTYSHVPKEERGKLDVKTRSGLMLGYGKRTKAYRLYDETNKKPYFSRDVRFEEELELPDPEEGVSQDEEEDEEEKKKKESEPEAEEHSSTRHPERVRNQPDRFGEWVTRCAEDEWANLVTQEPTTHAQAVETPESEMWIQAMDSEMKSLEENQVWRLTDLPRGKSIVGSRWVFRRKTGRDGTTTRYKARLVARGFTQRNGYECGETFSPVVRAESVRTIGAWATMEEMTLHQMDVKTAFLNGELKEEVYMKQPEGYEVKGQEQKVCRLLRSIYGLKQSPRCWNQVLDRYLKEMELTQIPSDPCVYVSTSRPKLIVAVYVDDIILAGKCVASIQEAKRGLSSRFQMEDLGKLEHFLGIRVIQEEGKIWFGQPIYTAQLLQLFGMTDSKPVATPSDKDSQLVKAVEGEQIIDKKIYQAAIGGLLYLSTKTRPDISFAVGNVARFCGNPTQ